MKYHETSFDDYLNATEKYNFHPQTKDFEENLPENKESLGNIIIYGPSGTGKYTRALRIIRKYSHSDLKYEKKLFLNSEKYKHSYKISDIHYEIDMDLLGCNAKLIWHDLFLQIVDIVSMSSCKFGIILCKNFHTIHTELLPIFYSYMQQYNSHYLPFQIRFILLTEQISFITNNILNNVKIINIKRPDNEVYKYLKTYNKIDKSCILNLKENHIINKIPSLENLPSETFDVVCCSIIEKIENTKKINLLDFRELLYEILIYNLDFNDVLWEIITYFIKIEKINIQNKEELLENLYTQIKQYNNNYRPIYHLENILLNIVKYIHYENT